MAKVTAQQYVDKQARRLIGATEEIRQGVQNVTEAPGVKAARKADKMLAGITEAINSGKWQEAVANVSLPEWQRAMLDKGIGRIPAGVEAAKAKNLQMAERLLAAVDSVASRVNAMPDTNLEDRIAKSVAFMREMAKQNVKG